MRSILKTFLLAAIVLGPSMVGATAFAGEDTECNGVFSGATPKDPITKIASTESATPGSDVTFTIGWHSTGVDTADVTDCYRVDDGENATLNALVEGFNLTKIIDNVGEDGTLQSTTFTITIPDDDALIGHSIVDRAKITHGSVESRSGLLSVAIVAPPTACPEDEGPDCTPPSTDTTVSGTKKKTKVLGTRTLAATGSESTGLAWLGTLMLIVGITLRFVHVRPLREVFARQGAVALSVIEMAHVSYRRRR
jgi:hypothetical protein